MTFLIFRVLITGGFRGLILFLQLLELILASLLILVKDADGIGNVLSSGEFVLFVIGCVHAQVVDQLSDHLVASVGAWQHHLTYCVIMAYLAYLLLVLKLLHLQLFYFLDFVPPTHGYCAISMIVFCLFRLNISIEIASRR